MWDGEVYRKEPGHSSSFTQIETQLKYKWQELLLLLFFFVALVIASIYLPAMVIICGYHLCFTCFTDGGLTPLFTEWWNRELGQTCAELKGNETPPFQRHNAAP